MVFKNSIRAHLFLAQNFPMLPLTLRLKCKVRARSEALCAQGCAAPPASCIPCHLCLLLVPPMCHSCDILRALALAVSSASHFHPLHLYVAYFSMSFRHCSNALPRATTPIFVQHPRMYHDLKWYFTLTCSQSVSPEERKLNEDRVSSLLLYSLHWDSGKLTVGIQ